MGHGLAQLHAEEQQRQPHVCAHTNMWAPTCERCADGLLLHAAKSIKSCRVHKRGHVYLCCTQHIGRTHVGRSRIRTKHILQDPNNSAVLCHVPHCSAPIRRHSLHIIHRLLSVFHFVSAQPPRCCGGCVRVRVKCYKNCGGSQQLLGSRCERKRTH